MPEDRCEYRYKAVAGAIFQEDLVVPVTPQEVGRVVRRSLEEGTVVSPAEDSELEEGMEEQVRKEGSVSTA